jgi:hypothetical protein
MEELLTRVGRSARRQRRFLAAALVGTLVVGGYVGYLIAPSINGGSAPRVSAFSNGIRTFPPKGPSFEPRDADAARAAVASAFHAAIDGGVSDQARDAAIQDPARLRVPRSGAMEFALGHGYTNEQLLGTAISVLDTSFIDPTHAVVRFSMTVPGHGEVLVDRVGYAIREGGRWRVALRTSCDLFSITGLWRQCSPNL